MLTNNQSIILTVHNKGFLISRVLESIKETTNGNYELIIVLDGCTDNSKEIVEFFMKNNPNINTKLIETPDVFETMANNAGLREASNDIVIIIQDDMVIKEHNWNERLTKPFRVFNDVFAVTANCSHNWEINPNSKHISSDEITNYEWSDILRHVDHANKNTIPRNVFAIRQCVNRGPLAINREDLVKLGYFDESFAPQDMDDHDLCFRMYDNFQKVVGCYWIDYESDSSWGGTRASGNVAPWLLESNQKNTKIVYNRHKNKINKKININREC